MLNAKQAIYAQNAKAKLVYVKNKDTYKVVCAFNVTETTKNGAYKFPTQAKCNFVSGDISAETLSTDLVRVLQTAKQTLRTNNIVFVE